MDRRGAGHDTFAGGGGSDLVEAAPMTIFSRDDAYTSR
jgi:hypothetical protein